MHLIKPGNYQYNVAFRKAIIPRTFERVLKRMTKYHSIEVITFSQGFPI